MTLQEFSELDVAEAERLYGGVAAGLWSHLHGDWERAHRLAQSEGGELGCWLHALLHKVEGDADNSRYWYRQAPHEYQDYQPEAEAAAILAALVQQKRGRR